jgi:hypothetical protein
VEIIQIFGASMEHTPWYRFPFMDFLQLYFQVLSKEASIVLDKHGPGKAFGMAFATDMIPGVVMALLFAQLKLLALPLALRGGTGTYDEGSLVEQLVLTTEAATMEPSAAAHGETEASIETTEDRRWMSAHPGISHVVRVLPGLYTCRVPTFKGLTEVFRALSCVKPSVNVLSVSGHTELQVKVVVDGEWVIDKLKHRPGVSVMFDFKNPVDGSTSPPRTEVALCVHVH